MANEIEIGVTKIENLIEISSQPTDQIIDIGVTDNADNVVLNITPSVIEININRGTTTAGLVTSVNTRIGDVVIDATDVGLGNVDNTGDYQKPISIDTQIALNEKADLVDGLVPTYQLPSFVDDVLEFADLASFPTNGEIGKIYIAISPDSLQYRWTGSTYLQITNGLIASTNDVPEGNVNLYFLASRVLNSILTGLSTASSTIITATDTVLSAFGKLQGQIFLKANDNAVVHLSGTETITGNKIFTGALTRFDNPLLIKQSNSTDYNQIGAYAGRMEFLQNSGTQFNFNMAADYFDFGIINKVAKFSNTLLTANRNYSLPNTSGTLSLTSDLSSYLPLVGGSLTGALNGTTANFTQSALQTSLYSYNSKVGGEGLSAGAANGTAAYLVNNSTTYPVLNLIGLQNTKLIEGLNTSGVSTFSVSSAGAATFSSSVTATDGYINNGANNSRLSIQSSGASTNSYTHYIRSGVAEWSAGMDNTDNAYVIGTSNGFANRKFQITQSGAATFSSSVTAGEIYSKSAGGSAPTVISNISAPYYGSVIAMGADVGTSQGGTRLVSRNDANNKPAFTIETSTNTQSYGANPNSLTYSEVFRIASTGAATFSSSVTAGGLSINKPSGNYIGATFTAGVLISNKTYSAITVGKSTLSYESVAIGYIIDELDSNNNGGFLVNYGDSELNSSLFLKRGGNVGIGTTAPLSKLSFGPGGAVNNINRIALSQETDGSYFYGISYLGNPYGLGLSSGKLSGTANPDIFIAATSGNVGIGTTTPSAKLDVNGTFNATGAATFASSVTATKGFFTDDVDIHKPVVVGVDTYSRLQLQSANYGYIIRGGLQQNVGARFSLSVNNAGTDTEAFSMNSAREATFSSSVTASNYRIPALNTTPASANATGTLGEIRYDSNYIYLCTATNTWKRTLLSTW